MTVKPTNAAQERYIANDVNKFGSRDKGEGPKYGRLTLWEGIVDVFDTILALLIFIPYTIIAFIITVGHVISVLIVYLFLSTAHRTAASMMTIVMIMAGYAYISYSDSKFAQDVRMLVYRATGQTTLAAALAHEIRNYQIPEPLKPLLYTVMDDEDVELLKGLILEGTVGKDGDEAVPFLAGLLLNGNKRIVTAAVEALVLINSPESQRALEKHGHGDAYHKYGGKENFKRDYEGDLDKPEEEQLPQKEPPGK